LNINVNATTLLSVAITSVVQGAVTVFVVRYMSRTLESIEKLGKKNGKKDDSTNGDKPDIS